MCEGVDTSICVTHRGRDSIPFCLRYYIALYPQSVSVCVLERKSIKRPCLLDLVMFGGMVMCYPGRR